MLLYLNRNQRFKRFLNLSKDIHAHLIPNIDDGPDSMEESLTIIENLSRLGYKELTATPHVFSDFYPNSQKEILDGLKNLQEQVRMANIPVQINSGAEYFLDYHFETLLQDGQLLPVFDNYVLVEISTYEAPPDLYVILDKIREKGYWPILAHPERYLFFKEEDYVKLIQHGCSFQLNMLSITPFYGKSVQKRALYLLKKNWVHYLGTDIHKQEQLAAIESLIKTKIFERPMLHRIKL